MNIVCIYWHGNFRRRDFTSQDVWRLLETVDKHMDRPYHFYCLTNDFKSKLPGEVIPLIHNWPGWWAKVELHRPDLPVGRTLYLDLDTHIIRSLNPILDYPGDLVMFNTKTAERKRQQVKYYRKNGLVWCYQASVMLFDPGTPVMKSLYEKFCTDPDKWMKIYRSEQDIMGDWMPDQPVFPDGWLLKLSDCRKIKEPGEDVIIITGQPNDTNFREPMYTPWLREMAR